MHLVEAAGGPRGHASLGTALLPCPQYPACAARTHMQLINRPSASHSNLQSLAQRGQAFSSCTSLPGYASVSSSGGGLDPTPHTQTQQGNSSNTSRNYFSLVVIPYLQGMLPAIAGTGTAPPRRRNLKKSDSFDVEGAEGKASAGSVVLAALGIPVQHRRLVCYALVVFTLALSLAGTAVVVLSPKASVSHANCPARKPHKPADLSTLPQYKGPPGAFGFSDLANAAYSA